MDGGGGRSGTRDGWREGWRGGGGARSRGLRGGGDAVGGTRVTSWVALGCSEEDTVWWRKGGDALVRGEGDLGWPAEGETAEGFQRIYTLQTSQQGITHMEPFYRS